MKYLFSILLIVIAMTFSSVQSFAWLIYHKPEFRGRVIDAETKEPIEGAVVVAVYNKYTISPIERYSSVIDAKETLTDKNGEFYFPSYSTLIQPFSGEGLARFIIYKPGYGNFPDKQITPIGVSDDETFFSKGIGKTGELEGLVDRKIAMIKVTFGIVELPKLKTREERLRAIPSSPTDIRSKELPLLYRAINEEGRRFGLGEVK